MQMNGNHSQGAAHTHRHQKRRMLFLCVRVTIMNHGRRRFDVQHFHSFITQRKRAGWIGGWAWWGLGSPGGGRGTCFTIALNDANNENDVGANEKPKRE